MLWLGDNVYMRESDWSSRTGMLYRYTQTRSLPELQPLLAAAHHYAVWDDHDYGPNDSDLSFRDKDLAREVFRLLWGNPAFGVPGSRGVTTRFSWADVEFFLLDDRYHRSPNRWPDGPDKTMFGAAQLEWLKQALVSAPARSIKLVAGGSQFWKRRGRFEREARALPAVTHPNIAVAYSFEEISGRFLLVQELLEGECR